MNSWSGRVSVVPATIVDSETIEVIENHTLYLARKKKQKKTTKKNKLKQTTSPAFHRPRPKPSRIVIVHG